MRAHGNQNPIWSMLKSSLPPISPGMAWNEDYLAVGSVFLLGVLLCFAMWDNIVPYRGFMP